MKIKQIITCLLAALGLTTACGQQYENRDVNGFAELTDSPDVFLLDVRTADEYGSGHIDGATNVDVKQADFVSRARAVLPADGTIAVYCRSGMRSALAAGQLAAQGYRVVNLKGGINAWKKQGQPVTTDTHEVDVFRTSGGKTVKLRALMHASICVEYDGRLLVIDPVTRLGDRAVDYSAMSPANCILVTHEHGDHFDREAIERLSDEHTRLITNRRCADQMGYGTVMANGDTLRHAGDITVEAVPAYNTTEGHRQYHPKGRDNGFVLTLDGLRIYIAGDTEDIPEMASLRDIDIAFLPCNQPYTMTPDQLLNAARMVKPRVLFPYHYGQTDVRAIPALLRPDGIEVRIRHYE